MQSSVGGSRPVAKIKCRLLSRQLVHMHQGPGMARRQLAIRLVMRQVRGGLTTCPPGLQLQLHQASIGRVQASQSSS